MDFNPEFASVQAATNERFGESWLKNYHANRSAVRQGLGISALRGKLNGIPCIIVGAGPSLDKNLKYLRWAVGRSLIISCDAALSSLLSEGIVPNFVTVLDPQEKIRMFFQGVDTSKLRLVAPTIVHPEILSLWKGSVVFFNKFAPDIPVLDRIQRENPHLGALTPGGSVLTITYDLAYQSGTDPIIIIGQDLSFPKGKGHSTGSFYDGLMEDRRESIIFRDGNNMLMEKNIFGKEVPTLKSMSVTKDWFKWAFAQWRRPNPARVVNSTENGILSTGCEILPLAKSIEFFCAKKIDIEEKLKALLKEK